MMNGELFQQVVAMLSGLGGVLVAVALFLLWRVSRSPWLIVALVAELISLGFRALMFVAPELMQSMPLLYSLWSLCAIITAIGLLGYAINETNTRR